MKAKTDPFSHPPRIVLLATVGMSPGVLTETVWALARPDEKRVEHIVPDDVVVITTKEGEKEIRKQLLGEDVGKSDGWARLVRSLKEKGIRVDGKLRFGSRSSIQLISTPDGKSDIEDLRTSQDNLEAANFFLRQIQHHIGDTKDGSVRLYTSIAGGRKTMGALLFSCMSLLGREQDHILHVLVNAPFDNPGMKDPFLFPENKSRTYFARDEKREKSVHDRDAVLSLIDIPFVRMHASYENRFGKGTPATYRELVEETQVALKRVFPTLVFDFKRGQLFVEGDSQPVKLATTLFLLLAASFLRPGIDDTSLVYRTCECETPVVLRSSNSWLQKFRWNSKNPFYEISNPDNSSEPEPRSQSLRRYSFPDNFRSGILNRLRTMLNKHPKLAGLGERMVPTWNATIPEYEGTVKLAPGSESLVDALFGPKS